VALGVAGNVIAFVDFLWTILSEARGIYKSPAGESDQARFIDMLVSDVDRQNEALLRIPRGMENGKLKDLVKESRAISNEIVSGASVLKKSRSRWRCFLAALKEVWGRGKTDGLMRRLGMLQSQITTHLVAIMT
jgi:hypothetical protein